VVPGESSLIAVFIPHNYWLAAKGNLMPPPSEIIEYLEKDLYSRKIKP
jgi:hypothetical protein